MIKVCSHMNLSNNWRLNLTKNCQKVINLLMISVKFKHNKLFLKIKNNMKKLKMATKKLKSANNLPTILTQWHSYFTYTTILKLSIKETGSLKIILSIGSSILMNYMNQIQRSLIWPRLEWLLSFARFIRASHMVSLLLPTHILRV